MSIWHGTVDRTVVVGNIDVLAAQWRGFHVLDRVEGRSERGDGWEPCAWSVNNRAAVETWRIAGMGHGVPIGHGTGGSGSASPFMLPSGIDSTAEIARS